MYGGFQRPVVAAVDRRAAAHDIVELGSALARVLGTRLVIAHAYHGSGVLAPVPAHGSELPAPAAVEDLLLHAASFANAVDEVELRALDDPSVGRALDTLVRDEDAVAVVVGATRRTGPGRLFPGSTAERLIHRAMCAVAVAPDGSGARVHERMRVIGCAFDGGAESQNALDLAVRVAAKDRAALELITWLEAPELDAGAAARAAAERELAQLHSRLAAEFVLVRGARDSDLARSSAPLDMLVCGSRGYGPLRAVTVGGFSHRLLRAAACPLLVLPSRSG